MIQGMPGYCDKEVRSAVYGRNQRDEFIQDAKFLGFTVEESSNHIAVKNGCSLITGEWTPNDGGMIAWSE